MKAVILACSLLTLVACSSEEGGGTGGGSATGTGGASGTGGDDASGTGGGECAEGAIAGRVGMPPSEGLYGCATASACREAVLHAEIQWGQHQSLIDVEECMGELVAEEQPGVLRWESDELARVAVLRGDGTALVQELSFTFGQPAPEGCWTVQPSRVCVVEPVSCDDEACETPRWIPGNSLESLTDCVPADPAPTCEDVAALFP